MLNYVLPFQKIQKLRYLENIQKNKIFHNIAISAKQFIL